MTHLKSTCNTPSEYAKAGPTGDASLHEAVIVENKQLARDTYRVRLHCREIARKIQPGQFVMLRLADRDDPVLGRPLAMYDTVLDPTGAPVGIDLVYLVVGKMTGLLAQSPPGTGLTLWGPLGNGFSTDSVDHLILVAGGIGQTPLLSLGKAFAGKRQYGGPSCKVDPAAQISLCYGVRSAEMLAGISDFEQAGIDVHISSDDGTIGYHGMTTDLLEDLLKEHSHGDRCARRSRIACCGPVPMMRRVAQIAAHPPTASATTWPGGTIPCEVSLETPMACGIGICYSCVVKVEQADGAQDYVRTCMDGPVFDAAKIVW
jgi:dihydroorotate dehydrogenase electron transfer subunit